MLSKSFKPGKCKTSLKLAVSRIKLLKNKRDIQVKHLKRELAQLLATGQEQTARIRVEHVIREEKTMSAYDLIEIYCELIVARLPIIESQKSCPIDLKEAISSVIFASPRCADVPELVDVRKQFVAKYGKEFVTSALELRPDCGVNRMTVEKLSAKAPDLETKIKVLTAIAKEHDVKWDSKAFEELQKPKEDLLNGSSSSMHANKTPMEPLNVNYSQEIRQTEASSNTLQNEIPRKTTSFNSTSHSNTRTSASHVPITQNEWAPDRKAGVSEARDSYPSKGTASSNQPTWTMEFKDAVSAAQVAAESAERASMAARAAAELASRGNISRQNSNDPNDSSIHSSRNTVPNRVSSSRLKDERTESVSMDYNRVKGFQGVKEDVGELPRDEFSGGISHHNADAIEFSSQINNAEKFDDFRGSFSRTELTGNKNKLKGFQGVTGDVDELSRDELSGGISDHNVDAIEFSSQINNAEKFDGFGGSFSRTEFTGSKSKHEEVGFVEENVKVNYDRSASSSSSITVDDDTIWTPIGKHQAANSHQIGDHKQPALSDFAVPVFDEYDPEPNDKRNLFDSFDNKKIDQNLFSIAPSTSTVNSNTFNDSLHESRIIKAEKVPSSKFDDNRSVTYDDSDGISSENDDVVSKSPKNRTVQNSRLLHEESGSSQGSGPREELQPSSSSKSISLRGSEEEDQLQAPSSSSVGTKDFELASGGDLGLKLGRLTGGLRNRGYNYPPYTANSVVDSSLSSKEIVGSTISSTERTISQQEKTFMSHPIADEGSYEHESSGKASTNPEFGHAKESGLEEYTEVSRSNNTLIRDESVEDTSGFGVYQFVSDRENSRQYRRSDQNPAKQEAYDSTASNTSEVIDKRIHNEKPHSKAYKDLSPGMSKTDFDFNGDGGERDSQVSIGSKGNTSTNSNIKLSRRTRDLITKGRNNLPGSTRYSDIPNADSEIQPLPRAVDQSKILQGNPNLKSRKTNSSAEQPMHEYSINKAISKNSEGIPIPDTNPVNSGNINTSDSGGGLKLQGTEPPKASHVHPKLPDYDTLAAHFQSLRSNRR